MKRGTKSEVSARSITARELYEGGLSIQGVADEMGIARSVAAYHLKRAGYTPNPAYMSHTGLDDEARKRIAGEVVAGATAVYIAAKYGVSDTLVRRWVHRWYPDFQFTHLQKRRGSS